MNKLKLLLIGILANTIENLILLLYFAVPFSKQMLISSGVFAIVTILLYEILGGKNAQ